MRCPVCHVENDQLALTCVSCHGFLQNRVPNLDLFSTVWQVIERPRRAFQQIALAEHKNYALLLFAFFGVNAAFTGLSMFRMGDRIGSLPEVMFWGVIGGATAGLLLAPIVALVHWGVAHAGRGRAGFRVSLGVCAYAFVPIVANVLFILPIELLTFGMYLFTRNPDPMTIKPVMYTVLIGIDAGMMLWSTILLVVGTSVSHRLGWVRGTLVGLAVAGALASGLYAAAATAAHAL